MKKHITSKEIELKLKVPEKIARLYFHATPTRKKIAIDWFMRILDENASTTKSRQAVLNSMHALQAQAKKNKLTPEVLETILGESIQGML